VALYLHVTSQFSGFGGLVVSMLASGTQVRGSDFSGEKILSMPTFGGEVNPSVSCRSFAACKKPPQFPWKSHCRLNLIGLFLAHNSTFH
jgi:hypothetical protein